MMKIGIGNDHAAVDMKNEVVEFLKEKGYEVVNFGTDKKEKGIRAVVCSEPYSAKLSRQHNNTNVLAFGARVIGIELAKMIIEEWLNAEFMGGRHQDRIDMITEIENENE